MSSIRDLAADIPQLCIDPPVTALGEDGLHVAFKKRTGVLDVVFSVIFGGGYAVKCIMEDTDNPLLLTDRWDGNGNLP